MGVSIYLMNVSIPCFNPLNRGRQANKGVLHDKRLNAARFQSPVNRGRQANFQSPGFNPL
jgi:hypothetical protein